jgi:phenylalanyl-tRNA synthetase alpha chain
VGDKETIRVEALRAIAKANNHIATAKSTADYKAIREIVLTQTRVAVENATSPADAEAVRVALLGKKGPISALYASLPSMPIDQRKSEGAANNELRVLISERVDALQSWLKASNLETQLKREALDVTLPVPLPGVETGRIHPISQVMDEIVAIFAEMGFSVAEGPDIESDDYNFTKLNFPPGHPAREMHDTFFLEPDEKGERKVLRTHTSPVQVRTMLSQKPPIRVICPGRTYRRDADQTHTPMFHQIEGLVIDQSATLANLKWVLEEFCKAFFEVPHVGMRFRPSFFPFTSPSLEVDIQCRRSGGEIRFGEGEDWLEILGCGMVHPNVLTNCGLDHEVYQGFAWGIGLDRLAMLKYGLPDLRDFFDADLRWINHYGFKPLDIPTLAGGLSG